MEPLDKSKMAGAQVPKKGLAGNMDLIQALKVSISMIFILLWPPPGASIPCRRNWFFHQPGRLKECIRTASIIIATITEPSVSTIKYWLIAPCLQLSEQVILNQLLSACLMWRVDLTVAFPFAIYRPSDRYRIDSNSSNPENQFTISPRFKKRENHDKTPTHSTPYLCLFINNAAFSHNPCPGRKYRHGK